MHCHTPSQGLGFDTSTQQEGKEGERTERKREEGKMGGWRVAGGGGGDMEKRDVASDSLFALLPAFKVSPPVSFPGRNVPAC